MLPTEELNGENSEGKQEKSESEEQEILPCFDLVTEILSRLPVKSLMRFRSVSKSWLALICSPKFIKSHLSLSANNNKDYTNHRDYPMKNTSISFSIKGSVNGLICLVNGTKKLFLWNPSSRKYKKLPDFKINPKNIDDFIYGFGYDEIHDDYKVVRINNSGHLHDIHDVDMYSLKNDSWRRIDCPQSGVRLISSGKFVNGKLHWASSAGLGFERGWSITSFDLADEKWGKVERPCYRDRDGILMLGALGSNLSMICKNPSTHVDIWFMKEYGDKESWIKMFTINYTLDPMGYLFSQSFYLSKRGEFLLVFESTFMIYNPKDNSLRFPKCPKFGCALSAEIYIESLVCPISQNEPRTQQE
ncbi:F-box/kelch-repeat protein At3g23880-like [Lycium ferocissimum]|uniref:F-box/kelch-repeat protein At3g23880-like n=1 Tax=Lycium ferocissimum TaxID=112874 RepID=UPI002815A214|nr:F-box/kelch-repeat protein At3g23880-like [Lycium ferocissimum]